MYAVWGFSALERGRTRIEHGVDVRWDGCFLQDVPDFSFCRFSMAEAALGHAGNELTVCLDLGLGVFSVLQICT